jgi:hypothetical protein
LTFINLNERYISRNQEILQDIINRDLFDIQRQIQYQVV